MSKEILKACPFCGSEAKIETRVYDYTRYWIKCTSCKAEAYGQDKLHDSLIAAVAAWNTRTPDKELVEAIEDIAESKLRFEVGGEVFESTSLQEIAKQALSKYKGKQ